MEIEDSFECAFIVERYFINKVWFTMVLFVNAGVRYRFLGGHVSGGLISRVLPDEVLLICLFLC